MFKTNTGTNNTYIKIQKTSAPYGLNFKTAATEWAGINNFELSKGLMTVKVERDLKKPSIAFIFQSADEKIYFQFAVDEDAADYADGISGGEGIDLVRTGSPTNQMLLFLLLGYLMPADAILYFSMKHEGFFESKRGQSPNFKTWAEWRVNGVAIAKLPDLFAEAVAGQPRELRTYQELANIINYALVTGVVADLKTTL
jgi:hypothetical protein